jgi:hypothetical protein
MCTLTGEEVMPGGMQQLSKTREIKKCSLSFFITSFCFDVYLFSKTSICSWHLMLRWPFTLMRCCFSWHCLLVIGFWIPNHDKGGQH